MMSLSTALSSPLSLLQLAHSLCVYANNNAIYQLFHFRYESRIGFYRYRLCMDIKYIVCVCECEQSIFMCVRIVYGFVQAVNLTYGADAIKGLKCITAHEIRYKGTLNRRNNFFYDLFFAFLLPHSIPFLSAPPSSSLLTSLSGISFLVSHGLMPCCQGYLLMMGVTIESFNST